MMDKTTRTERGETRSSGEVREASPQLQTRQAIRMDNVGL